MWLLYVSVLICSARPGSKRPPWKQVSWRWAALEGFPSQRSSRTPKILESCQSTSKLIFTSTSTTTSLWRWSSRWNCSPVPQAEPTDSRNESSSMLWWENVFYEQEGLGYLPGGYLPPPKFGHLPPPNSDISHPPKKTFARRTTATPIFFLFFGALFFAFST